MILSASILLLFNLKYILTITWSETFDNFPASWKVNRISNPHLYSIVDDPQYPGINVLNITHPKDSCSSSCQIPNGAGFDVKPITNFNGNITTFEYEVFFHKDFDFVRGGKLPGIWGGTMYCSGCNSDLIERNKCFSFRFMWGSNGNGYPYLYLPLDIQHEPDFCSDMQQKKCEAACGWNYKPMKYFERGQWTHIKQHVELNTPGKKDGILQVWINGIERLYYNKMIYRTNSSIGITGFHLRPFFGGGHDMRTPVETYTMYKNFKFSDY